METYLTGKGVPASGNLFNLDPLFAPLTDWELQGGSPVIGSGLDLSANFTNDKNNDLRSVPWSMGAYEKD